MSTRGLRKHLLTTLAILNLTCWIGLAGTVGLLLTDRVDLGLETLLRHGQATAVAAWEREADPASTATAIEAAAVAPALPLWTPAVTPGVAATSTLPAARDLELTPSLATSATPAAPGADGSSDHATRPADTGSPSTPAADAQPQPGATVPAALVTASATPPQPTAARPGSTASPDAAQGAPSPTQALHTVPLLLADPAFVDLSQLNAEMDRSAPGRPVQIRYQEAALNGEIGGLLMSNATLPYRDVTIDLQRGRVVVTGKVTVLGLQVDATIEGTISVQDCQPHLEIESVSVASVVTPGFVRAEVAEMVQEAMDWYPADYALCIEQIVLEETKASIYGYRR